MAIPFINALPEAPQRTDARPNFALRADVFFAAIDPMRYQMNQMAAWMNDQRDDIYSYSDNVEAWMNATLAARNAAQAAATNAAASESAAKDHLDDTAALIAGFTPTGDPLPEVTSVNAPLVVATPQGGVKFSRRALNNGAGVRPALRFDFANQGYLDPRIKFSRPSVDNEDGKTYGLNEPVINQNGLKLNAADGSLAPTSFSLDLGVIPTEGTIVLFCVPSIPPVGDASLLSFVGEGQSLSAGLCSPSGIASSVRFSSASDDVIADGYSQLEYGEKIALLMTWRVDGEFEGAFNGAMTDTKKITGGALTLNEVRIFSSGGRASVMSGYVEKLLVFDKAMTEEDVPDILTMDATIYAGSANEILNILDV